MSREYRAGSREPKTFNYRISLMAEDNNIEKFTAADIERYHRGQLSAIEMHTLEKAALDDPFLADALEGFSIQGINISDDIAGLKKRLAEKTEPTKIIPITATGRSFPWLRAAVMIVLVAGAGLLAYQFLFKAGKNDEIAQAPSTEKNKPSDSSGIIRQSTQRASGSNDSVRKKSFDVKAGTLTESKAEQNLSTISNTDDRSFKDSVTTYINLAA